MQEEPEHKQKTRLIVCVDGAYCDADGPDTSYSGNSTTFPVVGNLGGVISTATVGGLLGTEVRTIFGYSKSSLDLGWEPLTTSLANKTAMGAAVGGEVFMTGSGIGAMALSALLVIPLVWGTRAAVNVLTAIQLARLLLRHIADTILIMERIAEDGNIDSEDIR
ncbi:hypothetical protein KC349_g3906 [Hortaea werneckii]|nr:hypothetical protein KC349_g3906 [Hortaea werneckii]